MIAEAPEIGVLIAVTPHNSSAFLLLKIFMLIVLPLY